MRKTKKTVVIRDDLLDEFMEEILLWWQQQAENVPDFVKRALDMVIQQMHFYRARCQELEGQKPESPQKRRGRRPQAWCDLEKQYGDLRGDLTVLVGQMKEYCRSEYLRVFDDDEKGVCVPLRLVEALRQLVAERH